MKRSAFLFLSIFLLSNVQLDAQSFGRNKPRYRSFDFKVKETEHFDIHYYLKNREQVDRLAQWTEQWYDFHQQIVFDTFSTKNPIIFYNNHADFQQTNAISGTIGVGTGGVTEALKNRVVMPLTFTNQQTYQVLGHELVHAFQFHIILGGSTTSLRSLGNLPLWMVEGMAEYMSIGRYDSFTSMWMRDALLNDNVPTIKEMYNPRYFPYRYGQAIWSYLAGFYGDDVIEPLFYYSALYGVEIAMDSILQKDTKTISNEWKSAMDTYYAPHLRDRKENFIGKKLLSEENSGRINVSPSISPNGRYVIFLSEKDLFSTDLYLADARTGEIINKVSSLVKDNDLDAFNYLESAGTWSPNSKEFAFIGFAKGRNVLVIKDPVNGKTLNTLVVPKVPALAGPVWSPDGKEIVVSGLVEGQTDLYSINIRSGRARKLTNDIYSEIQPSFSADGKSLVFSYDQRSFTEGRSFGKYTFDLALMDYETQEVTILDIFHGADNINPSFNHEGNIYFVSDREGFRDLYLYKVDDEQVVQMTEFLTGISGITRYSPAISASVKRDRVLYTHYFEGKYSIYQASSDQLLNRNVSPDSIDFSAGILPVTGLNRKNIVNQNIHQLDKYIFEDPENFRNKRYSPSFKLDYVGGGGGVGVSNSTFGSYTGLQGGVDLLFSDMLGNNQLFTQISMNGTILDFGGQVSYLNKKNQLAWGASISHIPYLTGYRDFIFNAPLEIDGTTYLTNVEQLNLIRIFNESVSVFAHYPLSTTMRIEGGVSGTRQAFRLDEISNYYDQSGFYLGRQEQRVPLGDTVYFNEYYSLVKGFSASANVAIVGDNSFFGLTSPLLGYRYRLSLEKSFGVNDYVGVLADYRKYFWMKPFSFAFRGLSYIRFEREANSIYPLYIGQMGFVRGYDFIFDPDPADRIANIELGQLLGSKMGLANFEIRIPFTGPKQLALLPSKLFYTDLAFFIDAGVAFDEFSHLSDGEPIELASGQVALLKPTLAASAGVALRINLFGALILEPYFAWPLKKNTSAQFGFNFIPGW